MQPAGPEKPTDKLDYIKSMLGQLKTMAEDERCDMLAYLIEMAHFEVRDVLRGERPRQVRPGRRRHGAA